MAEKILVVEDDPTLQETLAYNLERQSYEVVTAERFTYSQPSFIR